ncbi:MAG: dTDP-glucose 4,6-dehydratase [Patescibacteria group bacterium]
MTYFVTGGAGFIGANFIQYILRTHQDAKVVNFDALTYAGNLENLVSVAADPRYRFVQGDITNLEQVLAAMEGCDVVVNFAAESHNDRAILDPGIFVRTNVMGTQILLEGARRTKVSRFHHISTCEVFGDLALDEDRMFKESDSFAPKTPYNASKAAANHIVTAYYHTYKLPVTISHCANNYGPFQFPEKVIPLFVTNALEDKPLPLFKSSQNRREWIHVDDHSAGIDAIVRRGTVGESYNIGTRVEKSVEQLADAILEILGKPQSLKSYVPDRLQHDRRYVLDPSKIMEELGWVPLIPFDDGLRATVEWYRDHQEWWKRCKSGEYQKYYDNYYNDAIGKN